MSLAPYRNWSLQGESDRRFHRQNHVPFSSERGAYRACCGSRACANQRTGSAAGYRPYRRASTRPAADPQPVALLVAPAHATRPVGVDIIRNASQGERVQTQRQSRTPFETPRLIGRHHVSLKWRAARNGHPIAYHERFVQGGGETVARAVPLGIDRLRQPDTNASAWLQY